MSRLRNKGVALFTAVFLIVVLGAVAVTVALIATTQNISSAQGLDATRALYAARARVEREIDDQLAAGQGSSCPNGPDEEILGFTTTFTCDEVLNLEEGGATYDVLELTVTAFRGDRDGGTRVRREIRVQITRGT